MQNRLFSDHSRGISWLLHILFLEELSTYGSGKMGSRPYFKPHFLHEDCHSCAPILVPQHDGKVQPNIVQLGLDGCGSLDISEFILLGYRRSPLYMGIEFPMDPVISKDVF